MFGFLFILVAVHGLVISVQDRDFSYFFSVCITGAAILAYFAGMAFLLDGIDRTERVVLESYQCVMLDEPQVLHNGELYNPRIALGPPTLVTEHFEAGFVEYPLPYSYSRSFVELQSLEGC